MDRDTLSQVIIMIDKEIKWLDCRIQALPLRALQEKLREQVIAQWCSACKELQRECYCCA